jgi:hypothetical protein
VSTLTLVVRPPTLALADALAAVTSGRGAKSARISFAQVAFPYEP